MDRNSNYLSSPPGIESQSYQRADQQQQQQSNPQAGVQVQQAWSIPVQQGGMLIYMPYYLLHNVIILIFLHS